MSLVFVICDFVAQRVPVFLNFNLRSLLSATFDNLSAKKVPVPTWESHIKSSYFSPTMEITGGGVFLAALFDFMKGLIFMTSTEKIFDFVKATLNLFKAVPSLSEEEFSEYKLDNEKNISNGFFVTEKAFEICPCVADRKIFNFIKSKFGYNLFELNQGFYKSFQTVADSTPQKILANKLLHYMSTYGFESLGIFDRDTVYIPPEKLELPEDAKPIKITVIDSIDNEEIETRTVKMIMTGAALSKETLNDVVTILKFLEIKPDIDEVPNKELKNYLCDILGILPKNPVEFLRYLIYKSTKSTLLIKNNETIQAVKEAAQTFNKYHSEYIAEKDLANLAKVFSNQLFDKFFADYIEENGIEKLASVFHRFKPLWLAFKRYSPYLKTTINKMRKLADRHHKPAEKKILETLTSESKIDLEKLKAELSKVTVYKKVSIVNALLYRSAAPESIAFYIRNGKVFVKEFEGSFKLNYKVLSTVIDSIVEEIRPNVEGKTVYIPEYFNYAVPVSEKKFVGAIPYGSSYNFGKKSVIVGAHWFNLKKKSKQEERVDLDLHLNSTKRDIGWQNDFGIENFIDTKNSKVIFSGDMTDASIDEGGATEAFFVGESLTDEFMMVNLNNFTRNKRAVPFKLILCDVNQSQIDRNYLIDSHEIAFCMPYEMKGTEMFLGFLDSDEDGNKKFYFTSGTVSDGIVARSDEKTLNMISYTKTSIESCLSLKEILQKAGAIFEKGKKADWDINLDPAEVTKDILLGLLSKN